MAFVKSNGLTSNTTDPYSGDLNPLNDQIELPSNAESTIDYSELVEEDTFIGDTPFSTILDGLNEQFKDYINLEDNTDYVDIFYTQMEASINAIMNNELEDHVQEKLDILKKLDQTFTDTIADLFKIRLTITIIPIENEDPDDDDQIEGIVRALYKLFILDGKNTLKVVISNDIINRIGSIEDDLIFYREIDRLLPEYSPLIRCMPPSKFLRYCKAEDVIQMYESGNITGNFLRKYTPKFYQNEEFQVEAVNYISVIQAFKKDLMTIKE